MDQKINLFAKTFGVERVKLQETLTTYTFSKSIGVAEAIYVATTQHELIRALEIASELKLKFMVIGGGTKISIDNPVSGLIIKNRTISIKIAGIKGKFDKGQLGMAEMYVESDSGVTIKSLNDFLTSHGLKDVEGYSSFHSTVGGAIFLDRSIREATQSVKVWQDGEILTIDLESLDRHKQIVLGATFRFKSL